MQAEKTHHPHFSQIFRGDLPTAGMRDAGTNAVQLLHLCRKIFARRQSAAQQVGDAGAKLNVISDLL